MNLPADAFRTVSKSLASAHVVAARTFLVAPGTASG